MDKFKIYLDSEIDVFSTYNERQAGCITNKLVDLT